MSIMEKMMGQVKEGELLKDSSESDTIPNIEPELSEVKYDDQGRKLNAAGNRRGMARNEPENKKEEKKEQREPFSFLDRETLNMVIKFPFQFYAATSNNLKWVLTDDEASQAVVALDNVVNKYVPDVLTRFGEESELCFFLCLLVIKKVGQPDKIINKSKKTPKNKDEQPHTTVFDVEGKEIVIDKTNSKPLYE